MGSTPTGNKNLLVFFLAIFYALVAQLVQSAAPVMRRSTVRIRCWGLQRVNMYSSKKAAVTPYRNMVGATQSAQCVIKRAVSEAETV